jgi:cadmium resistance protein CadD (predicted permease)
VKADLFSIVGIAAVTFCATNVDDLALLFGFLANRSFRARNVIVGYALGTLAILGLSWIGALLADLRQPLYVGFLGFVPIGVGLKHLYDQFIRHQGLSDPAPVQFSQHSQIATVALADVSHGPDTIMLYSVLLAEAHNVAQLAISLVYIILLFVWCAVGFFLLRHPLLSEAIQRYGHRFSPYLLIVVGAYIVLDTIHSLAS